MGAPIDDTATLATIVDAMIRDPLETPTGVMKRFGMGKSDRTRVLRKWARHATKLKREAAKRVGVSERSRADRYLPRSAIALDTSRTGAGVKESDLKLDAPAFLRPGETVMTAPTPHRPLWKRLLGIRP